MYSNGSIFGTLANNIAVSMAPGIYSTARMSINGTLNAATGEYQEKIIGKNSSIICEQFVCEQQNDNDFFCK